jgi:uncharacterized protein YigE (DUF2233 family)
MNCKILLILLTIYAIASCNGIDDATKKVLKKQGKKVAKQIVGTAEHFDGKNTFIAFETNTTEHEIKMYWKDDNDSIIGSLGKLKEYTDSQGDSLLYACNGGMYMANQAPLGWFIQNKKQVKPANTKTGKGNFYIKPKGIFYILKNSTPIVQAIENGDELNGFAHQVTHLTQSGPMLVHDGKINEIFTQNSLNINVRNGVGILPNGNAIFAMSTYPLCFYDFAKYFVDKGCKEALYLDGFVSRTYCPSADYMQTDGAFGVMIGVVKRKKTKAKK